MADKESEINIDQVVPTGGLYPGAIMSLAFATETEALQLALRCKGGLITEEAIREAANDTGDPEPMLALGWLARWADALS